VRRQTHAGLTLAGGRSLATEVPPLPQYQCEYAISASMSANASISARTGLHRSHLIDADQMWTYSTALSCPASSNRPRSRKSARISSRNCLGFRHRYMAVIVQVPPLPRPPILRPKNTCRVLARRCNGTGRGALYVAEVTMIEAHGSPRSSPVPCINVGRVPSGRDDQ
jgi:hypothetical protein